MTLPQARADGSLPPGRHLTARFDEIRAAFPAVTARRQRLESALAQLIVSVRQLGLGSELVIDGSYTTGKPSPSDIDLALLSTGATEAEVVRRLAAAGVDLTDLDLFVETTRPGLERWIQFFSLDRVQRARGVVILTI